MYHLMSHFDLVYNICNATVPGPNPESFVTATLSSLFFLVTVPTNLLVCLAILIDPNNELRTQFNCFTFNLALADFLVGCITESTAIYVHVREGLKTLEGDHIKPTLVQLVHIQYFISAMASVLSISALALERYLAVTRPFTYRQYFSVKLAVIMSIIIWSIAIGFGLTNISIEYILESFIFVNAVVVFTGLVVAFVCYKISSTLRDVSNNWETIESRSTTRNGVQRKLTKTFVLIIVALVCCYVPACSVVYYMNLCQHCDCALVQWFRDVAFWCILLNSAINPFVYAVRFSSFRSAMKKILCSGCGYECYCCPSSTVSHSFCCPSMQLGHFNRQDRDHNFSDIIES